MNLVSLGFGQVNQIGLTRRCDHNCREIIKSDASERARSLLCVSNDNNEEDEAGSLCVN